jgi:hypothetical protein
VIAAPPRWLTGSAVVLSGTYGVFMGCFAWRTRGAEGLWQVLASTVKLPMVYLLTLAVTMPSLCVFGALSGVPMRFGTTARMLVGAVLVNAALAASLGPILGFFTLSTTSYPFIVALNVVLLGASGAIACGCLVRSVRAAAPEPVVLRDVDRRPDEPAPENLAPEMPAPGAEDAAVRPGSGLGLVLCWTVLYALVGMQMGWVLRPVIGAPGSEFVLVRPTEGTAIGAVFSVLRSLVGG